MKYPKGISLAKTLATGLAVLSFTAFADTFWKGTGTDSDFYNRDNWLNWWNANYVFGGGQLGILPADGSYVTFTNAAAIAQGLWIENANKGGVEWSLAENAEAGAGLTITNSLTIGTGKAGQLTIKGGEYLVRGALNVASGIGTDNGGSGKSILTLTNCTMTVGDGVFIAYGADGANGEVVVKADAILNSTASSGDKFSVCKSANGHHNTKGTLTIDGGTVNVASTLFTCQESGTGDITINSGALNVFQNSYLARGWYNGSTSTLTMNGGTFWTGGNFELAAQANRNVGTATLNMNDGAIYVGGSSYWGGNISGDNVTVNMTGGLIMTTNAIEIAAGPGSTADVTMSGGTIMTANSGGNENGVMVGNQGIATFTMNGGEIAPARHFIVGRRGSGRFVMNGGTITTTTSGETWIGGSYNDNNNKGIGVFVMNDGLVDLHNWMSVGRTGTGRFELNGGTFQVVNNGIEIARYGNSTGTVVVAGGTFDYRGNQYLAVGFEGDYGELIVSNGLASSTRTVEVAKGANKRGRVAIYGGAFNCGDQFWVGEGSGADGTFIMKGGSVNVKNYTCVSYGNGTGHFIMDGGMYYQTNNVFIVGQGGNADAYGECIVSNGTINVPNLWVSENAKPGTLTMEGGEFISRGETQMSRNIGAGKGMIVLNGGTLSVFRFVSSSGTGGEVIFNGGTLKALDNRGDFIPDIANCEFKIAAGGAVFDTNGKDVTVADTLGNADGIVGNGTIAKEGLGTLTISSNLDLERTFKFTIDDVIGPIALTGTGNTLDTANSKKITVEIDPVAAETNVAYTVMTGLGELTMDNIILTGTDFYTYTGEVTDGTLSVTLQYGLTAPITARYADNAWGVYNYNNELIPNGTATNLTTYVFNGSEPAGDIAAYGADHKVLLESGTIAIDSAVVAGHVAVADGASVRLSGSGAASFAVNSLVNNGTLVFDGEIMLDAPLSSGTISITEGAVLHLVKSQTITCYVEGKGEMVVDSGVTLMVGATGSGESFKRGTEWFQPFEGTFTISTGATLVDMTDLHAENNTQGPYYFLGEGTTLKMAGGTISRFGGATNNEYIQDVVIAEGTTNVWDNSLSRSGNQGVNLNLTGTFSGTGMLQANCNGRSYRFYSDFSEFGGVVEMTGSAFEFRQVISGGTWIANPTAVLMGYIGGVRSEVSVTNATLVLKGSHMPTFDVNNNVISTGTYTIGVDATLKVADDAFVEGITFTSGAMLEMLDDGALSDAEVEYVALTSTTPIAGPLPSLVQEESRRGKWKLYVKEVTENETTTYQLLARFRRSGFLIIVQ